MSEKLIKAVNKIMNLKENENIDWDDLKDKVDDYVAENGDVTLKDLINHFGVSVNIAKKLMQYLEEPEYQDVSLFQSKLKEEDDNVWGGVNDQRIYDRLNDFDLEHLVSKMMSDAEENPKITLLDYLKQFDNSDEDDLSEKQLNEYIKTQWQVRAGIKK